MLSDPRSRRLLLAGLSLSLTLEVGCSEPSAPAVAEPSVGVGGAEPQDAPVPTGDADDPARAQIIAVDGPETAKLGQIVSLRITTDFEPIDEVENVAIALKGTDTWFKVEAVAEVAPESAPGKWQLYVPAAIIADPELANTVLELEFALLNSADQAGGFKGWSATLGDADDIVECPFDAQCDVNSCGPDPLCATTCGGCTAGQACNLDGVCEGAGGACPDAADCGDAVCGVDPVCGTSCGSCDVGLSCQLGMCVAGEGDCCTDNTTPGCGDATVSACVCESDRYCCETSWDQVCADLAATECGACPTGDGDGDTTGGDGDGDGDSSTTGDGDTTGGDGDTTGGDGDTTGGDGDTMGGDGDGDGDTTAGDGDGDSGATTAGDGDGDSGTTTAGDGDGDSGTTTTSTTGDGDGDSGTTTTSTTGDGDGDTGTTGGGYDCDPYCTAADACGSQTYADCVTGCNDYFATVGPGCYDSTMTYTGCLAALDCQAFAAAENNPIGSPCEDEWTAWDAAGCNLDNPPGGDGDGDGDGDPCINTQTGLVLQSPDAHVDFSDTYNFTIADPFSIEMWVQTNGDGALFTKVDQDGTGYRFGIAGSVLEFSMADSGGNFFYVRGQTNVVDGAWHHVVASYDGAGMVQSMNLVVDGNDEVFDPTESGFVTDIISSNNALWGLDPSGGYQHMSDGIIDELRIYGQPRFGADVINDYLTCDISHPDLLTYHNAQEGGSANTINSLVGVAPGTLTDSVTLDPATYWVPGATAVCPCP